LKKLQKNTSLAYGNYNVERNEVFIGHTAEIPKNVWACDSSVSRVEQFDKKIFPGVRRTRLILHGDDGLRKGEENERIGIMKIRCRTPQR
jgi:hypothetical protein